MEFRRTILMIIVTFACLGLVPSMTFAWTGPDIEITSPEDGAILGTTSITVEGTSANGSTERWVEDDRSDFVRGELNQTQLVDDDIILDDGPIAGMFNGCGLAGDKDSNIIWRFSLGSRSAGTVEMWVKWDVTPPNDTRIFEGIEWWGGQLQTTMMFSIRSDNNTIAFGYNSKVGSVWTWRVLYTTLPSVGEWHHLVGQWGSLGGRFYIDGVLKNSHGWKGSNTLAQGACIGSANTRYPCDSAIVYVDEVRFSSTQLYSSDFTPSTTPFTSDSSTLLLDHLDGTTSGTNTGWVFTIEYNEGSYTSPVMDTNGELVDLTTVDFSYAAPSLTCVTVSLRWSKESDMSDASNWTELLPGVLDMTVDRYLQYRVGMGKLGTLAPSFSRFSLTYWGVESTEVSTDGDTWFRASDPRNWSVDLELDEGLVTIYVASYDTSGNISIKTVSVLVDLTPPSGYLVVGDGQDFTRSREVPVRIEARDNVMLAKMMLSKDPSFTGTEWEPFSRSFMYDLGPGDGIRTLYVKVRDVAGHESPTMTDSIILDTTPPIGEVTLGDGSGISMLRIVDLSILVTDENEIGAMRLGNLSDISERPWVPYREDVRWDLGLRDGYHTVVVEVRDPAGNVLQLLAEVILDLAAPVVEIELAGGDDLVTVSSVTVLVTSMDANGVQFMRRAMTQAGLADADWVPFGTMYLLDLNTGDVEYAEWVEVKDVAGQTAFATDSLVLDTTLPEGSIAIAGTPAWVHEHVVTLELEASDATSGIDYVRVSNSPSFTGAVAMDPVVQMDWELASGEGTRMVYYEVVDIAGHRSEYSTEVIVATTPPSGGFSIIGDVVGSTTVALDVQWEGAVEMAISDSANPDGPWVPVVERPTFELSPGDGIKNVYVRFRGPYGLLSETVSDSIVLDTTLPTVRIHSPEPNEVLRSQKVTVQGSVEDSSLVSAIELRVDDGQWITITPGTAWTHALDLGDWGEHTITVRGTDIVGNSAEASVLIISEEKVEPKTGISGLAIALIVVVAILAAILAMQILRNRKTD